MDSNRLEALRLSEGLEPTANSIARVGSQTSPSAASWAFTQWDLRKRAAGKFPLAGAMLFDRDGLEMASSALLASIHTSSFPVGARIADLTCGIGGDLIGFAARGPALGYETDPERAAMARHNLAQHGLIADIRIQDCLESPWDFDYAFADPSRRSGGRRTLNPSSFEPPLPKLSARMSGLEVGVIKLSPMLSDQLLEGLCGKRTFVSLRRECKEVLVALGRGVSSADEAEESAVCAIQAESSQRLPGNMPTPRSVVEPMAYLFEADPAAIRAHALGALCEIGNCIALGSSNGYLTSDQLECGVCFEPWVRAYRVLSHGRADERAILSEMRKLDTYITDVKHRVLGVDPAAWRRRLRSHGTRPCVLVLYPHEHSIRYSLAEPVP